MDETNFSSSSLQSSSKAPETCCAVAPHKFGATPGGDRYDRCIKFLGNDLIGTLRSLSGFGPRSCGRDNQFPGMCWVTTRLMPCLSNRMANSAPTQFTGDGEDNLCVMANATTLSLRKTMLLFSSLVAPPPGGLEMPSHSKAHQATWRPLLPAVSPAPPGS